MCQGKVTKAIRLEENDWKWEQVDECIASLVMALFTAGFEIESHCCGHGEVPGHIYLSDGRRLMIKDGIGG